MVYKGVLKVTYDRGYALQTKSLLVENSTTSGDVVDQLYDAFRLKGNPTDFALEECNLMTGSELMLSLFNWVFRFCSRSTCLLACLLAYIIYAHVHMCFFPAIRILSNTEAPLNLQLEYGPHQTCIELRLVQLRDTFSSPAALLGATGKYSDSDSSDETLSGSPSVVPKEEGRLIY